MTNILLITTDQQRTDSLSCMGSDFVRTPNLDRLASEGILFTRAYCSNPVCTPSRASIFSGQHVGRHGAWNVGTKIPEDLPLLSHRLGEVGYRTHSIGKMHFQPFGHPNSEESMERHAEGKPLTTGPYYGFESVELACGHTTYGVTGAYGEWVLDQLGGDPKKLRQALEWSSRTEPIFGGAAIDAELPAELQNSVWTAERTCAFLRDHDKTQPFLLSVGFQDPHHPHAVPRDYTNRVDPADVPLPDYVEGELTDKPPHFALAHSGTLNESKWRGEFNVAGTFADISEATLEATRLGRAYYYTLVQQIDDQMGRILECLDKEGLTENTLVIFTSDHGELLGDHGMWGKGPFHYEQLVRVPLIVRWPESFPDSQKVNSPISLVDLAPTVMAAAGVPVDAEMDGLDLGPFLRGNSEVPRDDVLIQCVDDPAKIRLKTVVTQNWKCTWYADQEFGELYDLESDPGEHTNLWDDPAYSQKKSHLLGRLLNHVESLERREPRWSYA